MIVSFFVGNERKNLGCAIGAEGGHRGMIAKYRDIVIRGMTGVVFVVVATHTGVSQAPSKRVGHNYFGAEPLGLN